MLTKKNRIDDKVRRTVRCMIIGSSIFALLVFAISILAYYVYGKSLQMTFAEITKQILKNIICILIGYIYTIFAIYSMTVSIANVMDSNDEKYAKGHMVISSLIRLISFCLLLIILINENTFGVIGGLLFALTALGIKVGAYLTPFLERKLS